MSDVRRLVARLALDLLAERIDYATFLDTLPPEVEASNDPQIALLLDRIEHEPAKSRLGGLPRQGMSEYSAETLALITELQHS